MSHFEWENIDINAGNIVIGIISNIDYENMVADVKGIGTAIPIHYHCEEDAIEDTGKSYDIDYPDEQDEEGASAFSEEDEVLVMYRRVNDEDPVIVGFPDEALQCIGEYTLIRLYLTGKIHRCIVWNIKANRLATDVPLNHLEEDPEIFATFPCNPDNISDWLEKHVDVGGNLYSGLTTQVGEETQEECACDPSSACNGWWSQGDCHGGASVLSDCVGANGEPLYSTCDNYVSRNCSPCDPGLQADGINESYYTIPALQRTIKTFPALYWNQGLMGSYKLFANNMEEPTWTCLRHEKSLTDYTLTYHCNEALAQQCDENDREDLSANTKHTFISPFAEMGSFNMPGSYSVRPWEDPQIGWERGSIIYAPGSPPLPEDSRIKKAYYTFRSMVQVFFYEVLVRERYRPCAWSWCLDGWSGGSPEGGCEWVETDVTRHTFIAAHANDFLSRGGTENIDPRKVDRQSIFETAISDLLEDFYDFNGATSEEIWDFGTEVSIRDKDEAIIP